MKNRENRLTKVIFAICAMVMAMACGVKGKPVPPETPPPLGRGKPAFSKASEELQKKKKPTETSPDDWSR